MIQSFFGDLKRGWHHYRSAYEQEQALASENPHLAQALEEDKREGQRLAVIARTAALAIVFVTLPLINSRVDVIIYEIAILFFIALGWLQLKAASAQRSGTELALIFIDILALTLLFVIPNPFIANEISGAFVYRFDTFVYFFIILAVGTLAYSWRTVWAMGSWVAILWLSGLGYVTFFGRQIPGLDGVLEAALSDYPVMAEELLPNFAQPSMRFQEVIVFVLVAGILALKGWRSRQLLIRQANIAAERANLSRYFPSSIVDVLASTNHDIGAVRSQDVAVLFTDIVGFTRFAEQHTPDEVMALLRDYHARVERAIFKNKGTLDKYLGDGVMATFGTPQTGLQDAANALNAAVQLIAETDAMNKERQAAGQEAIKVSIGLHYGPVILGDIGPARRLEFAVVGDTVNVASRLEASTRELGCRCVVSGSLMDQALQSDPALGDEPNNFKPHEPIILRGRETPVSVWTA